MKKQLYIFLSIFFLISCDEVIQLDIDQTAPVLVIEAQFTNRTGKNYVRITKTTGFYDENKPPSITDALVTVKSSEGEIIEFLPYSGSNPDSSSFYLPQNDIPGKIGIEYLLTVTFEGKIYEASDTMLPVTSIDSLNSFVDPREQASPEEEGRFFQVFVFTKEPQETKDYYLFRFYRNWVQETQFGNDIYLADDVVLGESISGVPVPFYYAEKDTSVVEMYGISRQAFIYYTDLQTVLNSDGGMFSPPPANPRTNLSGGVLGFFTVASIESDTIIVK